MGGRGSGGPTNGGNVARGASFAAAKGAGLIGVAVLIGIVLLNVVDDGEPDGSVGAQDTETTAAPDAGEGDGEGDGDPDGGDTTVDTTAAEPPRAPEQLRVLVLNGGAPQGSAREMSDALQQVGYTNQPEAADWTGRDQQGNVVMCRSGLEREASTLAIAVGEGTPVEEFPEPPPPGADDDVACVVVVGASG